MSVCGQSGQTEDDSASEEIGTPATRDIYKQKPVSKVVRVLTVLAYLLSVSLAAILLSVYYICVWRSPELPPEARPPSNNTDNNTDYRPADYAAQTSHIYGGGDTPVNGNIIHSPPETITSDFIDESTFTEPTTEVVLNITDLPNTTQTPHNETSDDIGSFNDTDSIT